MNLPTRFMFETFDEAMGVHKKLFSMLRENGTITYADLYSLITTGYNPKTSHYQYGWTNLWGSKVEPAEGYINGEWFLSMPKVKKL